MTAILPTLTARHIAMLRRVALGGAELTCSSEPDLYVDGLCCTDHAASALLAHADLIRPTCRGKLGERVPAQLSASGYALLHETTTVRPWGTTTNRVTN